MTRIVSIWLPCWPIERLRRHDPSAVPDETPFALVESTARGIRVTAVDAHAGRAGIQPGLGLADARAACPHLITRPAEPCRDAEALLKLARWLGRYGPARNVEGTDGIWIDVTGVAHLFGGEERLMCDLLTRLTRFGITARAGLADTPGAAHALARYTSVRNRSGDWTIAPPGETARALSPLPVAGLRLDAETILLLRRLGLRRIGDLVHLPRCALERRFASPVSSRSGRQRAREQSARPAHLAAVLLRLDQAMGQTSEPRAALAEPPALSRRRHWSEPIRVSTVLLDAIGSLTGELCAGLEEAGLGARRVALTLYRCDGTFTSVTAGCSRASTESAHICGLLHEKLGRIDAGFGIDAAVLDALLVGPIAARQTTLTAGAGLRQEDSLASLIDRLAGRLGEERIAGLTLGTSHIPEQAQQRRPAARARPLVLFTPPEPVSVLAQVPEGPPARFTWRRVVRKVAKASGPERIAPEWWRHLAVPDSRGGDDGSGGPARDLTRDYYVVEAACGARFWMFREGRYGAGSDTGAPRWFLHGLFA